VAAARRFQAAGGTHLFLATQNYEREVPTSVEDYQRQFETTERLGKDIQERTGVVVYNVVSPYPIDLVAASASLGVQPALEVHRGALDLAGTWVREHRAVALGEVGWAHFPVPSEVAAAIDTAFVHALEVARDVGCPLVVHSPDLDPAGYEALSVRATATGVPPERVIKHYARSRCSAEDRHGIVPSYLARRELVQEVRMDPGPWFLETDFLDDPTRPGAVLDLATVPRRALAIAASGPEGGERLFIPFVDSVEKVYGWRPEAPDRGGR
jgi:TatD-related deoxyribonuclease